MKGGDKVWVCPSAVGCCRGGKGAGTPGRILSSAFTVSNSSCRQRASFACADKCLLPGRESQQSQHSLLNHLKLDDMAAGRESDKAHVHMGVENIPIHYD